MNNETKVQMNKVVREVTNLIEISKRISLDTTIERELFFNLDKSIREAIYGLKIKISQLDKANELSYKEFKMYADIIDNIKNQ